MKKVGEWRNGRTEEWNIERSRPPVAINIKSVCWHSYFYNEGDQGSMTDLLIVLVKKYESPDSWGFSHVPRSLIGSSLFSD